MAQAPLPQRRVYGPNLDDTFSSGGSTSVGNTTTDLLTSGGTFTGEWEQNNQPNVGVSTHSNIAGTLFFDFSNDGTNVNTFPTDGFTVAASVHEFHTAVKLGRFFRVRFVMGSGTQTFMRLYTYYGSNFLPSNAPIGFTIASDADAIVTKSVISGVGDTTAKVSDHKALQVTPPPEGKTAFGEASIAEPTPVVQLQFPYNINTSLVKSRANQSGTVIQEDGFAKLSTGAAANSSGTILSSNPLKYNPGQGAVVRFTSIFTTGVANSTQWVGIGDQGDGFFFGYNGTDFGIMRRRGGAPEVRTLTVTTGSSNDEDITITLDGDAASDVSVTNTGNTTLTANEIAAHDYSDIGRGWDATAVGSKVIFTSWDGGARTGTYSLSSASSAVGTFAQTLAGVAFTDTVVTQANWNGDDIFDGNGLTGVTLDPTKGNVYQIKYQWLGFGAISFYIEDPADGDLHLVHTIQYSNANTETSISNPSLPLCAMAVNTSNTSDIVLKISSMGAFIEGREELLGTRHGLKGSKVLTGTAAETPIYSFRVKEVYQGKLNRTKIKISLVGASVEHTKAVAINFYANATLTSASFSDFSTDTSIVEEDTSATAFSGGTFLFGIDLGRTGNQTINLMGDKQAGIFSAGNTITATAAPNSGNNAEANVVFNIVELF